jgi:hypothetical protein
MWYIWYDDLQYYKLEWAVYVWYRDPSMCQSSLDASSPNSLLSNFNEVVAK